MSLDSKSVIGEKKAYLDQMAYDMAEMWGIPHPEGPYAIQELDRRHLKRLADLLGCESTDLRPAKESLYTALNRASARIGEGGLPLDDLALDDGLIQLHDG